MAEHIHTEGLLHLAAFASAVAIAYIGLDKIHSADEGVKEGINEAQDRVKELLRRLDVVDGNGKVRITRSIPAVYVLIYVARIPWQSDAGRVSNLFHRIWMFIYRQKYIPMLGYFRTRADLFLVIALGGSSLSMFFIETYCLVYKDYDFLTDDIIKGSFWIYVATIFIVFFNVSIAKKVVDIDKQCHVLTKKVEGRIAEIQKEMLAMARDKPAVPTMKDA